MIISLMTLTAAGVVCHHDAGNSSTFLEHVKMARNQGPSAPLLSQSLPDKSKQLKAESIGLNYQYEFNFAVWGESNVGKSAFIDAVRNVHIDDPTSAKTRHEDFSCYTSRSKRVYSTALPYLSFWKLKSGRYPSFNFFEGNCLDLFDSLLLFTWGNHYNPVNDLFFTEAKKSGVLDRVAVIYSILKLVMPYEVCNNVNED